MRCRRALTAGSGPGRGALLVLVLLPAASRGDECDDCEAGVVRIGEAVRGVLAGGDCLADGRHLDLWRLESRGEPQFVRISLLAGPGAAPRLELRDLSCTPVASSDGCPGAEPGRACLELEVLSGTYYIAVSAGTAGEAVDYDLLVEPLDLCLDCRAGTISCGETATGALGEEDCLLWLGSFLSRAEVWRLEVAARRDVAITLRADGFDPYLFILDATCGVFEEVRAECRPPAGEGCLVLELDPGTYFLAAAGTFEDARGSYELEVRCLGRCDEECAAGTLACCETVAGSLGGDDCALEAPFDVYSFRLDDPARVDLELVSADFDALLYLRDDRCLIADIDDDGGPGRDARISAALPAGEYSVVATSFDGGVAGDYALSLHLSDLGEIPICGECFAGELGCGDVAFGEVALAACDEPFGLVDAYRLEVPDAMTVEIELEGSELWRAVPRLHVFDAACLPVGLNRDCILDDRSCTLLLDLAPGTYHVAVQWEAIFHRLRYDLTVRCLPPAPPPPRFLRGDCDGDGRVEGLVTDAVFLLDHSFRGGPRPPCLAACDANGDGRALGQVTDAVYLLNHGFLGGPAPAAPFPGCGPAALATDADLGCGDPPGC